MAPPEAPAHPLAPLAAFAACTMIWGSTFLVIRLGNESVPPLWAATLRLALAVVLLLAIVRISGQRLPRGEALRTAAVFGFLNFGLSLCLLYWGETTVPSGLTAVIYGTIPLTTALLARLLGVERPSRLKVAAALIAFAGVAAIFAGPIAGRVAALPLAAVLMAATFGSLSSVLLKRAPHQSPLGLNAVAAMVGCVICFTASVLAREPHALPRTLGALGPIVYLAIAGSVGAYVLFTWLLHHWPVTRASFIAVIVPLVALALGAVVRHERLSASQALGAGIVLAGLGLSMAGDLGALRADR
jgi:drug/metabolite transporter (DMT)-like permease